MNYIVQFFGVIKIEPQISMIITINEMCIHDALALIISQDNLDVFIEFTDKYKNINYYNCKCSRDMKNMELFSLFESAGKNSITILEHLLKNKTDPNGEDRYKQTPLLFAANHGHKESLELLLKYKADPNKEDNNKRTPLHLVARYIYKESVELLLKYKADPNKEDNNKRTPLHYAADNNRKESVELLLKYKADPNKEDNDKQTPLHLATYYNYKESVELLLKYKADPNIEDNDKKTPLHLATNKGHKELVELLLKYKADPNKEDKDKRTPLHLAANNGRKETFNVLYQITDAKYRNDPIIAKFILRINFKTNKINEQLFILQSYELDSTSLFAELCRDMIFVILKHIKNEKLLISSEELIEN